MKNKILLAVCLLLLLCSTAFADNSDRWVEVKGFNDGNDGMIFYVDTETIHTYGDGNDYIECWLKTIDVNYSYITLEHIYFNIDTLTYREEEEENYFEDGKHESENHENEGWQLPSHGSLFENSLKDIIKWKREQVS